MSKCQRCGKCCVNVGTIFVHSGHPIIRAILQSVPDDFFQDDGPCPMYTVDSEGESLCLIHRYLGVRYKPSECRAYPEDGEECFREKDV
jgi:hypothetical protein